MTEFWIGVSAVCAVLVLMGGLLTFFLRHVGLMVESKLAGFLLHLNGTYVRTVVFAEVRAETDRRLALLEAAFHAR